MTLAIKNVYKRTFTQAHGLLSSLRFIFFLNCFYSNSDYYYLEYSYCQCCCYVLCMCFMNCTYEQAVLHMLDNKVIFYSKMWLVYLFKLEDVGSCFVCMPYSLFAKSSQASWKRPLLEATSTLIKTLLHPFGLADSATHTTLEI